MDHTGE